MMDDPRPIRVLRVISRMNIGGPAIHVSLLTQKMQAPHYESRLVTGSLGEDEGDMTYYALERGVTPIVIPELGRSIHPIRDLRTFWKLYRVIREFQPDVIHTHTSKAGFVGRWAAWLAGVPVRVHTFHGHTFRGYFSPLKSRFFVGLEQVTAAITDAILALTQGLRRELAEEYHVTRKERITVLPLGLDLTRFAETPRKQGRFRTQWNIPQDAPLIGLTGRFVPVKNHGLFLAAAARIRQTLPDARFVLIGDGETRPQIEAQIDTLGLRDVVTITGWMRDTETAYADLDVSVISSINEGTPVTIIEALAAGCPVVATAVGGLPDLLDGGAFGRLVPSGDADALAEAILATLATPPDMREAQTAMLNRYGIDRLISDLDSLYRGLLAKKKARR